MGGIGQEETLDAMSQKEEERWCYEPRNGRILSHFLLGGNEMCANSSKGTLLQYSIDL